jgi:plastocyanin
MTSHDGRSRKATRKSKSTKEQKMRSFKFFKPALATTLGIDSWRLVLLLATAVSLIGHPEPASAATVNVTVGWGGRPPYYNAFRFVPNFVTIHPGDQVKWTWATSGHSTTSVNGIWDSGIRGQGATFTHTFNSAGTFTYYCKLHGDLPPYEVGQVIVTSATPTPTPPPGTTLRNISTRALVQTGDNVMIGGFIIEGAGPKTVILRAIGPELVAPPFNIPNALGDPTLELHDGSGALIARNDNWQTTVIGGIIAASQVSAIQNSGHAPTQPTESAIIAALQPGNYTAILRGKNNTVGVALVEVYDLSSGAASTLGNISTRGFVQTGNNVMIGGFIVQGTGPKRVILRAIGPELSAPPFNIPNALANPRLELHNGSGELIARNDNWQTTMIGGIIAASQVSAIQNSGHAPTQPTESAIIATLQPGNYTAIVRGVNNTTGVALVEVYDLD